MNLLDLDDKEYTEEEARKLIEYVAEQLDGKPRSKDTEGNCVYRGYSGARCAVGVLIPDSVYRTNWDERKLGVSAVIEDLDININCDYYRLLNVMQDTHDSYYGVTFEKESFISMVDYFLKPGARVVDWRPRRQGPGAEIAIGVKEHEEDDE